MQGKGYQEQFLSTYLIENKNKYPIKFFSHAHQRSLRESSNEKIEAELNNLKKLHTTTQQERKNLLSHLLNTNYDNEKDNEYRIETHSRFFIKHVTEKSKMEMYIHSINGTFPYMSVLPILGLGFYRFYKSNTPFFETLVSPMGKKFVFLGIGLFMLSQSYNLSSEQNAATVYEHYDDSIIHNLALLDTIKHKCDSNIKFGV